ncbi:MAG: DUF2304 domain-containing protein [Propionibacteriaceae bacterium]|jgi:hypothetical protein|nr:DUF2304 domain-containing protein [Propionibacteriaceae bacterium]
MNSYWFVLALCLALVVSLIQLLRRRRIREKYVALWIVVAIGVIVLGAFPGLTSSLARLVGIQLPANLVFTVALFFLLIVCVQLSVAVSSLEERTRRLTEEIALLRAERADSIPSTDPNGPADPTDLVDPADA